jgi:hypothetical protein
MVAVLFAAASRLRLRAPRGKCNGAQMDADAPAGGCRAQCTYDPVQSARERWYIQHRSSAMIYKEPTNKLEEYSLHLFSFGYECKRTGGEDD